MRVRDVFYGAGVLVVAIGASMGVALAGGDYEPPHEKYPPKTETVTVYKPVTAPPVTTTVTNTVTAPPVTTTVTAPPVTVTAPPTTVTTLVPVVRTKTVIKIKRKIIRVRTVCPRPRNYKPPAVLGQWR